MSIEYERRIRCTACGIEKRDTNHWYLLITDSNDGVRGFAVAEWDERSLADAEACACGERCTHTLISRWFETRTFSAPVLRGEALQ